MHRYWWKIICVLLLVYTLVGGFLVPVPAMNIINETIRNLYFHVPMWFVMLFLFAAAVVYSIAFLRSGKPEYDVFAAEFTKVGIFFSILGMITGMIWARYTWGEFWSNDPKQLSTALSMLSYFAYLVLRGGIKDDDKKARISAVYNVFVFALLFPLIFILPRMVSSLHPGNGGNPAFGKYDLDNTMRLVFLPAIIGWVLLGVWIASLRIRLGLIVLKRTNYIPFDLKK